MPIIFISCWVFGFLWLLIVWSYLGSINKWSRRTAEAMETVEENVYQILKELREKEEGE